MLVLWILEWCVFFWLLWMWLLCVFCDGCVDVFERVCLFWDRYLIFILWLFGNLGGGKVKRLWVKVFMGIRLWDVWFIVCCGWVWLCGVRYGIGWKVLVLCWCRVRFLCCCCSVRVWCGLVRLCVRCSLLWLLWVMWLVCLRWRGLLRSVVCWMMDVCWLCVCWCVVVWLWRRCCSGLNFWWKWLVSLVWMSRVCCIVCCWRCCVSCKWLVWCCCSVCVLCVCIFSWVSCWRRLCIIVWCLILWCLIVICVLIVWCRKKLMWWCRRRFGRFL